MKEKKKSDNKKAEIFGSREYFRRQMKDKAIIGLIVVIFYIVLIIGLLTAFKAMSL